MLHYFSRIIFHLFKAAFHRTVRCTFCLLGAHYSVGAFWAASMSLHSGATIFRHHLSLAFVMSGITALSHLANASANKAYKKYESYYNKKSGDAGKEFAGLVFSEFCEQQGACKNCQ
ncbi:MAG: hypothetical protein U1C46_09350 [Bacteroidales bacterium]|nr:hypothetical protein [Bacteroidales bacterium]MDZ4205008.1 hypothetical protein [Bacteroidales bacterium]